MLRHNHIPRPRANRQHIKQSITQIMYFQSELCIFVKLLVVLKELHPIDLYESHAHEAGLPFISCGSNEDYYTAIRHPDASSGFSSPLKKVNGFRKTLDLKPAKNIFMKWCYSPTNVIGAFPEWFAAPAKDWPPNTELCGFIQYNEHPEVWIESLAYKDKKTGDVELTTLLILACFPIQRIQSLRRLSA